MPLQLLQETCIALNLRNERLYEQLKHFQNGIFTFALGGWFREYKRERAVA